MDKVGISCLWPLGQASGMNPIRLRKKFGKELIPCKDINKIKIVKGKQEIEKEPYKKCYHYRTGRIIPYINHTP